MYYYVYILSNQNKNVIYTGVTNDLIRRVYEHKHHLDRGSFTSRYNVEQLVYYEMTSDVESAIAREKQIKGWNRKRKDKLIGVEIQIGKIFMKGFCNLEEIATPVCALVRNDVRFWEFYYESYC